MWKLRSQLAILVLLVTIYIVAFIMLSGETNELRSLAALIRSSNHHHGHILTLNYPGQQVAGIRGLFSQQCWVREFNLPMKIVAPFVENSNLKHSGDIWSRYGTVSTFNEYYDISHFNRESEIVGNPSLVSWENFLETSSKALIVVSVLNPIVKGCLVYNEPSMCSTKNNKPKVDKLFDRAISQKMEKALQHLKRLGFEVKRTVCLPCDLGIEKEFTPQEITEIIFGDYQPNDITLVIDTWRFTIEMTQACSRTCSIAKDALVRTIKPSKSLQSQARLYHNTLLKMLPPTSSVLTVGIMIRIEWFMIAEAHSKSTLPEAVKRCLTEMIEKYNQLEDPQRVEKGVTKKLPIIALDIGKYGSATFDQSMRVNNIKQEDFGEVVQLLKDFVYQVYDNKLTFEEWEETYQHVLASTQGDKGYIAYLQNTLVGEADCLMLMGGGHFQEIAKDHYLQLHSGKKTCVQHVCVAKPFLE